MSVGLSTDGFVSGSGGPKLKYYMRAYKISTASYITWTSSGSADSTGANSGTTFGNLSDIVVISIKVG